MSKNKFSGSDKRSLVFLFVTALILVTATVLIITTPRMNEFYLNFFKPLTDRLISVLFFFFGNLFITTQLILFFVFELCKILPEGNCISRKSPFLFFLLLAVAAFCKGFYCVDLFVIAVYLGLAVIDLFKVVLIHKGFRHGKSKERTRHYEQLMSKKTGYYVKWLIAYLIFGTLVLGSFFVTLKQHPYSLKGEIEHVSCNKKTSHGYRGGTITWWNVCLNIDDCNRDESGKDDLFYGEYSMTPAPESFFWVSKDKIIQHYKSMEGQKIWVLGAYDYFKGDLITYRELCLRAVLCIICVMYIAVLVAKINITRKTVTLD